MPVRAPRNSLTRRCIHEPGGRGAEGRKEGKKKRLRANGKKERSRAATFQEERRATRTLHSDRSKGRRGEKYLGLAGIITERDTFYYQPRAVREGRLVFCICPKTMRPILFSFTQTPKRSRSIRRNYYIIRCCTKWPARILTIANRLLGYPRANLTGSKSQNAGGLISRLIRDTYARSSHTDGIRNRFFSGGSDI